MAHERWKLMVWAGVAALLLLNGCGSRPDRIALQEGLLALDGSHYGQSIRLFQKAVRDNVSREDNALAYNGLGIAYVRIQQKDNAIRAFENAVRMDPSLVEPHYNLGVLQFESGKEAEAVICFEKAALIESRETRPLEFLAFIYQKRRQWDEARRVLAEAQSRAPRAPRVMTALALLELQTNNVETAVALLQQALEHDAEYPPAVFNLAVANQRLTNNPGQARIHFKDFLSLVAVGPQADKARLALQDLPASILPPNPEPKPEVVDKPGSVTVPPPSAADFIENARKLERVGRREAAVNNYLKAVREAERAGNGMLKDQALRDATVLCADDARSNYEMGLYYAEHKQNDQAMVYLKKAVSRATNWFDAQMALAQTAVEAEEFDTARISVKQADLSRPDQADALWNLAQLCDRNASLQDLAAQFFARFEKKYPADPRVAAARERWKALPAAMPRQIDNASGSAAATNRNASSWWRWF
ncbi:MAG: tetratricopeptide repeat protein [Verrucomicrobia bacterium]|nr:tetratricopeptide repeat protein [Verrucomicrobiota bacterium]MBU4429239.1 tetratricopeptide repeat protein [Verrucomicrobiota bacterium]MCG2680372.1 tetratricopeptide repeat protein [Kiritimatiellia bacterium]